MAGLPDDYDDPLPGGVPPTPKDPDGGRAITPPTRIMQLRKEREERRERERQEKERQEQRGSSDEREKQRQVQELRRQEREQERAAELLDPQREEPPTESKQQRRRVDSTGVAAEQGFRRPLVNMPDSRINRTQVRQTDLMGDTNLSRSANVGRAAGYGHSRAISQPEPPSRNIAAADAAGQAASQQSQQAQPQKPTQGVTRTRSKTTSTFPHAFERWETLSSHWEGLTGYWIKKLDSNKEELSRQPLDQQLARQVTDLSAAGANLFHAVVELQRLRASSERKFQRWFFETRKDAETANERIASLQKELKEVKQGSDTYKTAPRDLQAEQIAQGRVRRAEDTAAQAQEEIERVKNTAKKQLEEMRRELQISRDEARRGWEEIGRMEQSERDRMFSLKRGEPTLVGGVQVVPMGASRGAASTRPTTREGGLSSHPVQATDMQYGDEARDQYNYENPRSENDTDPFTESTHDPSVRMQGLAPPSQGQSTFPTSSAAIAANTRAKSASPGAVRPNTSSGASQGGIAPTTAVGSAYPGTSASYSLPGDPAGPSAPSSTSTAFYRQPAAVLHQAPGAAQPTVLQAEETRSYATLSEDDFLSEVQPSQPQPYQSRQGARSPSEASEDYGQPLQAGSGFASYQAAQQAQRNVTSNGNGTGHGQSVAATANQPDYEGAGYGGGEWASVPRHHHPTRLSDVLEEDERSRTSPSRASSRSRGFR